MNLNSALFWASYRQANETHDVNCMPSEEAAPLLAWIGARLDSREFLELIREFPLRGDEQFCAHYFFGPQGMKNSTESSRLIAEKYLVVGSAPNGDYIAITLAKPHRVGFVNHETLDDRTGVCDYVGVADDLGEFYYNSWNVAGYPCDYFEAVQKQEGSNQSSVPPHG